MNARRLQTLAVLILTVGLAITGSWPAVAQGPDPSRSAPGHIPPIAGAVEAAQSEEFKPGELLVKFRDGVAIAAVNNTLARHSAQRIQKLDGIDVEVWQVSQGSELDVIAQLNADPAVEYAEPNYVYRVFDTTPNDPHFSKQWGHAVMQTPAAWDISTGSTGFTIAIADSGVDTGHPDLAGKLVAGRDFVDGDSNPRDENGHGTHVAGIAAAITNNGTGVAGVDWKARIMPVRVCDRQGSCYNTDITNGIIWAYQHGADVINLSLGGFYYSQAMQDAVTAAHNAGTLVVAAMGNCRTGCIIGGYHYINPTQYPAALDNVLAVAATGPSDTYSSYSQYGSHCDVSAPGGEMDFYQDPDGIYSTLPTYDVYLTTAYSYLKNYDYLEGTSMATPYVAGLAALVWSTDPTLTPDEVQTIIEDTAVDLGASGWDPTYGHGRIDASAALQVSGPPEAPVLLPINNPGGDGTYLVDWSDVPSASSYALQEDDNPDFTTPALRYSGANSQFSVSGKGPGAWYYRVRATNDAGDSPWSNIVTVMVRPRPPVLDPISNASNEDAYTVSWSAADSATSYTLQEASNSSFSSPRTRYVGEALAYDVTGQAGGTWYYRVRASNSGGDSWWSNVESTTVDPPLLTPPTLLAIDNPNGDGDYLVDWSEVTGTVGYTLEESVDPYFTAPMVVYSGASSEFSVTNQSSGHWYYRVRAAGTGGNSPWSNEESVIVTTRVILPIVLKGYRMGGGGSFGLPIQEGFEDGAVPPPGWSRVRTNPRETWKTYTYAPYEGSFAAACDYDGGLAPQNEVLLSPEFQANSARLRFRSFGSLDWCRDDRDNCDLKVWLVVGGWGGGDDIYIRKADGDWLGEWIWSLSTINLTPYLPSGTPVRVGFQYVGQDGAEIALDSISITE